jgi:hypothetical protein
MSTVMDPGEGAMMAMGRREEEMPLRITTTLYDLITALQDVGGLEDDVRVVAMVVCLLQAGRLTCLRTTSP